MTDLTEGIIGISLGVVSIIGIQFICYTLFDEVYAQKAIVIALSCLILVFAIALIMMKIFGY